MTLSQLRRRIAVLEEGAERHFPKPKPPSEEMLKRLAEFLGRLLPTMAQEHWPLVEAYLKDRTGTKGALSSGLFHAFNRLWWRVRKGSERAVALPPVVVNVYLKHPNTYGHDDCADCGLLLPIGCFYDCPLCGGVTGPKAYNIKHKESGYQNLTPYRRDDPRRDHVKDGIRRTKKSDSAF